MVYHCTRGLHKLTGGRMSDKVVFEKSAGEKLDHPIAVRLTREEKLLVVQHAKKDGVTPSKWIRNIIKQSIKG